MTVSNGLSFSCRYPALQQEDDIRFFTKEDKYFKIFLVCRYVTATLRTPDLSQFIFVC